MKYQYNGLTVVFDLLIWTVHLSLTGPSDKIWKKNQNGFYRGQEAQNREDDKK